MKVESEFGTPDFTYVIYCAWLGGSSERLRARTVAGNPIKVVTLAEIISDTQDRVRAKPNRSVEPTTLGRFVQLQNAARINLGS